MKKFKVFNTNNLWVKISAIEKFIEDKKFSKMDVIQNNKRLKDGTGLVQLETAAGNFFILFFLFFYFLLFFLFLFYFYFIFFFLLFLFLFLFLFNFFTFFLFIFIFFFFILLLFFLHFFFPVKVLLLNILRVQG